MASAAISSQGTTISLGGSDVAEITGWSGFGSESDMIEVTSIDSPNDTDEWTKVLIRTGETSIDMNYTAATYAQIEALVKQFAKTEMILTTRAPDNKIYTTSCDVTSNKMTGASGDKISASVTVKLSGEIVVTDVV